MSLIGPGSIGALNIAGSFAGAQRNNSSSDQSKAEAADRSNQISQERMTDHSLGDVAEADLSSERDPDGRLPFGASPHEEATLSEEEAISQSHRRSTDPFGERGNSLDLEV